MEPGQASSPFTDSFGGSHALGNGPVAAAVSSPISSAAALVATATTPATTPTIGTVPPQAEVDDFLRRKRKAREHKSCYPCRQRKVKCDLTRPCKTCRDREHPEICNYNPPSKRVETAAAAAATGTGQDGPGGRVVEAYGPRANYDGGYADRSVLPPASSYMSQGTRPADEMPPAASGGVMLGRSEFEVLCRKLEGLENTIADLRREIRSHQQPRKPSETPPHGRTDRATSRDPAYQGQQWQQDSSNPQSKRSHTDRHGLHTKNESGEIVHVGGDSIPALLFGFGKGSTASGTQQTQLQEYLGKSVLPLFGLENESSVYPFVDLWGLPHGSVQRAREIVKLLPSNTELATFFDCYRNLGHVIFPGIADLNKFADELESFMACRAAHATTDDGINERSIYDKSYHWLGLLFAVLASGVQSYEKLGHKQRKLTSQVYVCCSIDCLRFINFLSQANMEDIQALVIISNVMSNNMNAGTAWSFLGLTIRLAQGLGLHQACPPHIPAEVVYPRSGIWWSIIWLDGMISMSYDRNAMQDANTMSMPQHFGTVYPYHASMFQVSRVALAILRDRAQPGEPAEQIARINIHRDEISWIIGEAAPHLRDSRKCEDLKETIEHWGLYLHTSYVMSELLRPAISRTPVQEISRLFRDTCLESLVNTVEAYLGLTNVTFYARQSWGAIHRGLSSAILLGILGEHERNERARGLISRFVSVMSELIATDDEFDDSHPISRGLKALSRLDTGAPRDVRAAEQRLFGGPLLTGNHSRAVSTAESVHGAHYDSAAAILTPSTRSDGNASTEDKSSPHSVLNIILWGDNELTQEQS